MGIKLHFNSEENVFREDQEIKSTIKPLLKIDEKPENFWLTLLYAFQITLVDFSPFIWAAAFVSLAGLPEEFIPQMISNCFFAVGLSTLLQTTIGNKLPIVQLPSVPAFTTMASVVKNFPYGLTTAWGAAFIAGIIQFFVGVSGVFNILRRLIPPVVIGVVVTTIGFVAMKLSIQWIFTIPTAMYLMLALLGFLAALFLKFRCKGLLSSAFVLIAVVLIGIIGGSLLKIFNWDEVANASWIAIPKLFPFRGYDGAKQPMIFAFSAIMFVFSGYICSIFESIGDYAATCAVSDEKYKVKHMNKGIMASGIGCSISSLFGALPVTSATQNIGIIASTGIASRFVTQVAAVLFILYGISPKFATLLACIPRSVIGGVFLISASLIMFSGLETIFSDTRNMQNNVVAGTTLGMAIMLPLYTSTAGSEWISTLSPFMQMYLSNNVFIAVTVGIFMNLMLNYVFKPKVEKEEESIETDSSN